MNSGNQNPYSALTEYELHYLVKHLIQSSTVHKFDELENLLTDLFFLEQKAEEGLIFELPSDFAQVLDMLPTNHSQVKILKLVKEAIQRDIGFISRYPTTLFQCLWNSCWWYDCPEASKHYGTPKGNLATGEPPYKQTEPKLSTLLEIWRRTKEDAIPNFCWIRSLRPPMTRLGAGLEAVFDGHGDDVTSVAFSPNGRRIVSGSQDKTIRVWDATKGKQLVILSGHEKAVSSAVFSWNGCQIVSGSADKTIRIWDTENGKQLQCLQGHKNSVNSVTFSPDGQKIVSGSGDKTVCIWDAKSGRILQCLHGHRDTVYSVAYSPDGQRIVSGSADQTVRLWNSVSGVQLRCLKGHKAPVASVAVSPNNQWIVSGSVDQTVCMWNSRTGGRLKRIRGHRAGVSSVAISPDNRLIASASAGLQYYAIRVWDSESGVELRHIRGHDKAVLSVAFSPDGRQIVSGSTDGTVRLWDVDKDEELCYLNNHEDLINEVAVSKDGKRIASASSDGNIRIYNSATGLELCCIDRGDDIANTVAFSPDGRWVASGWWDEGILISHTETGQALCSLCCGPEEGVNSTVFSPDGRQVVSGFDDGTVRIWDVKSKKELHCMDGHMARVNSVAFSPDGRRIVSGSDDRTLRVWNVRSGKELHCLRGHKGFVDEVAFSRDSKLIVSGSLHILDGRDVRIWDTKTYECLQKIEQETAVASIAAIGSFPDWRIVLQGGEIVVENMPIGAPLTWFPAKTHDVITDWSGRILATSKNNHLYILALEGDPTQYAIWKIAKDEVLSDWSMSTVQQAPVLLRTSNILQRLAILRQFTELQVLAARVGTEVVENLQIALVQNLGYQSKHPLAQTVRQAAVEACVATGKPILPLLLQLGKPEPWQFLANIVLVAGTIAPENKAVQSLLEDAARHPEPGVRMRVIMAVNDHDSSWAQALMISMAADPDPSVCELLRSRPQGDVH